MVNNNNNQNKFIPESVKKPTYTVSYFNEVEWNKDLSKADLKQQELIDNSYQVEYEAEVEQSSQCGPGKKYFKEIICRDVINSFGLPIAGRVLDASDYFLPDKNYVGAIIYSFYGNLIWGSGSGKSFDMIVKCTDIWPNEAFNSSGSGVVHDYLIKYHYNFANSNEHNTFDLPSICCSGFAWYNGELSFNSCSLNANWQVFQRSPGGDSDGKRELSDDEEEIVRYCWDQYTTNKKPIFSIPYWLAR